MAYAPATNLVYISSSGSHAATVLSDNKVMCTAGIFSGQSMLLVDWLILAAGDEIIMKPQFGKSADDVWEHAKQKAGIDPPSLTRVDTSFFEEMSKFPKLLVPPPVPASPCCDTEYACGCLELDAAAPAAAAPSAAAADAVSTKSKVPELAATLLAPSAATQLPELRFPPPLEALPQRHVGDKLKWELNDETYRIAVFTKKGLLEVKNVEDGGAAVHNNDCTCSPCSDYKMVPRAPWQPRLPLAKAFFETESAWRASLPQGGKLLTKYVTSRYNDWV